MTEPTNNPTAAAAPAPTTAVPAAPVAPVAAAPTATAAPVAATTSVPAAAPAAPAVAAAPAPPPPPRPVELEFKARRMNVAIGPFLNAQPLVWQLAKHHHLTSIPPVEMAAALKSNQVDVALAPIAAYFQDPSLTIIPIAAVTSKGPVQSVRILSHGPLKSVERLFVDERSKTASLLARLVLKRWYGLKNLEVVSVNMKSFHPNQVKPWEATLQFGDNALIAAPTGMVVTDLGEEWTKHTGKPFVWAVWMAKNVQVARDIENDLLASKNEGVKHFDKVAADYHGIWVFQQPKSKEYLEKNIDYSYGPEQVQGQLEFQKLLREEGLAI